MTDPEVPDDQEPAAVVDPPADASVRASGALRLRGRWALAALATLLAVASIVVAVVQMGRASDARDELDLYAGARQAASEFGAAYLTYDASDVGASSERVLSLTTDTFAREFEETRSPGIEALFDEIGTSTEATTTDVFVTEISQGRARALVVVDVQASSTETPDQTLFDLTFVLDLILDGDQWKVDAVSPAPRPDVKGGPETTTSTTSPDGAAPGPSSTPPALTTEAPPPQG